MTKQEFIDIIAFYVTKYASMFGIEVYSPIIAQAILESTYGTSPKAKYHNYFGLKFRKNRVTCNNGYFKDGGSEQNADGSYTLLPNDSLWYAFDSIEMGVLGYFQFTNIPNYAKIKGVKDPYEYLRLIKEANYATSKNYVENTFNVIQNWDLTRYDKKEEVIMPRPKVCIDAGHYGRYNKSPNNANYYESEAMWKLHLLQKKYLEMMGVDVVVTRTDKDKDLALNSRGTSAKGCDLFISDHTNAVGSTMNEGVDYVAVYHLVDDTTVTSDDISKEIATKLAPVISKVMGVKQAPKVLSRKSSNDRNNDGIMNDNYYGVLHGARQVNVAGLILEHSFHTNTNTVNWLLNDNNLDSLARAEAECIAEYLLGVDVTIDDPVKTPDEEIIVGTFYRVQCGAYKEKQGAINQYNAVKSRGFDCILIKVDNLYKVQVGAYSYKTNASLMEAKLEKAGFDAFITLKGGVRVSVEDTPVKDIVVGSTVRVKNKAKTYEGTNFSSFVYTRNHKVKSIKGDRVVITYDNVIVGAVKKSDLTLV